MATYLYNTTTYYIVARSTGTVFLNIPTSTQLYSTGMRSIIRRIIAAVNSAPEPQLYSTGMRSIIRRIIAAVNSAPEHGR